jgi:urease accessory protein UreH
MDASDRPAGWRARLELRFASRGGTTRLVHNRHEGPLRLIRALPQHDGRCQARRSGTAAARPPPVRGPA